MQTSTALRLVILLDEDDKWRHKPVYLEVVQRARAAGLAGATVWRGIEGFGASSRIHTTRLLDLAEHLPVLVMIVDEPSRVRDFVEQQAELLATATVTLDEVEKVEMAPRPAGRHR